VRGILACRLRPVVTTHAVARDALMVETGHRQPGACRMTVGALRRRLDVTRRLPRGLRAVVTTRTAAAHLVVIEAHRGHPFRRDVTGVTAVAARDVVRGLRGGPDARAARVAGDAITWRAAKHRVDVTGLTGLQTVPARQLEPGGQVVEIGGRGQRESHVQQTGKRATAQQTAESFPAHCLRAPLNVAVP